MNYIICMMFEKNKQFPISENCVSIVDLSLELSNGELIQILSKLELKDKSWWQSMSPDELLNQVITWKEKFSGRKSSLDSGSKEWLFNILRHNGTNYEDVCENTNQERQWISGGHSSLRLAADCMIENFLKSKGEHFYEKLTKLCREYYENHARDRKRLNN